VTFYWGEPCKSNGIITGYIVSYNITTSTANLDCPVEEHNMTFNVTGNVTFHENITDLYPWTTYMFCIAAQTTSGKGAEICQEQQTLQDCKYSSKSRGQNKIVKTRLMSHITEEGEP
jgi:hypothetical protein